MTIKSYLRKETLVEEVLVANYDKYYRLAKSYTHNSDDALDIVQNGACKAITASKKLKNEAFVETWIYRIMLNEIFRFCKGNKNILILPQDMTPETGREDTYENFDLQVALDKLPPKDKSVVILKYFEDMNQLKQNYKNEKMTEEQVMKMKETIEHAKKENRKSTGKGVVKFAVPFAAAIALFIAIPNVSMQAAQTMSDLPVIGKLVEAITFRNYEVETETKLADVEIPKVVVNETASDNVPATPVESAKETFSEQETLEETLNETTAELNAEIETLAQTYIDEFEANMEAEGYHELVINHETIQSNDRYFTLKLTCYEAAASGVEWNYYYTIDLTTGERLALKELFVDGADYITPISENIKSQMAEQMAADENIIYWLDDPDMPEWNFNAITDETEFFLNDSGNIVISFNEGDVAPMYMGVCTFEIPEEIVKDIRK